MEYSKGRARYLVKKMIIKHDCDFSTITEQEIIDLKNQFANEMSPNLRKKCSDDIDKAINYFLNSPKTKGYR